MEVYFFSRFFFTALTGRDTILSYSVLFGPGIKTLQIHINENVVCNICLSNDLVTIR